MILSNNDTILTHKLIFHHIVVLQKYIIIIYDTLLLFFSEILNYDTKNSVFLFSKAFGLLQNFILLCCDFL